MTAATTPGLSLGPLDALPLPCLIVDRDGLVEAANPAATRLLGVDPQFVVGKLLVSFVAQRSRRALRRLLLRPEHQLVDIELETRRNGRVPVQVSAARDGDRLLLVAVDRSGEQREEARAAALERRLDRATAGRGRADDAADHDESWLRIRLGRLIESLPQGVIGVDRRLRVTDTNSAALELLAGAGMDDGARRLPRDWHGFDLAAFAQSLFEEQALSAEAFVATADGREIRLIGMASEDRRVGVVLMNDVSERMRREQAERDFIANAAHELQSPIAAVVSAVDALELGAKDNPEDRDRFLRHLARESHRMQSLVRTLLELARAQHGGQQIRLERVELRPFLEDVAARLRPAEGVAVEILCPPTLTVNTSRELLAHAVGNAAANAARFTTAGRILLSALPVHGEVVVEVSDSGPGIPAEQRRQVLERFYRVRPSGEGAGLGLAIVRQAVEAMGARLTLDDAPGGGTVVRLALLPGVEKP